MMEEQIFIRAWVSGWHTATIEQARKLFKIIMRTWDKTVFEAHFRGISYERLAN